MNDCLCCYLEDRGFSHFSEKSTVGYLLGLFSVFSPSYSYRCRSFFQAALNLESRQLSACFIGLYYASWSNKGDINIVCDISDLCWHRFLTALAI